MRTRPQPVFSTTPQNALQDSLARLTRWLPDGLPGRLSGSQIAEKHPSGVDRRACRANPLVHVPGVRFATREPAAEACTFYGSDGGYWNAEW